jgi:DNA-binding transcriptional MerR regulator
MEQDKPSKVNEEATAEVEICETTEGSPELKEWLDNKDYTCKISKKKGKTIKPIISEVVEEDGKRYCIDAVTGKKRLIKTAKELYVSNADLQRMMEIYHSGKEIITYKFTNKKTKELEKAFKVEIFHMSNELGEAFMKIARKISNMGCFVKYSFKDEMISDAILAMVKSAHKYKVGSEAKSANPFAYFTKLTYNTFILRIKKEKNLSEKLEKLKREKYPELMEKQGGEGSFDYDDNNYNDGE